MSDQVSALAVRSHEDNAQVCFTVEAIRYEVARSVVPIVVGLRSCDGAGSEDAPLSTSILSPSHGREKHGFAVYVSTGREQAKMIC